MITVSEAREKTQNHILTIPQRLTHNYAKDYATGAICSIEKEMLNSMDCGDYFYTFPVNIPTSFEYLQVDNVYRYTLVDRNDYYRVFFEVIHKHFTSLGYQVAISQKNKDITISWDYKNLT